jgi:sterol desaturase/sphingolipid hydroxylase (fatty acid hydroxylase superfamily)
MIIASALLAAAAGAFTWTLLEYVFHRWLGHDARTRPNFFAHEHIRHHSEGNYFAPAHKKIAAAVVFALLAVGPCLWVGGAVIGPAYLGGLLVMYAAYEILHRREHTHPGMTPRMRRLRRHHFHHHFADPSSNHGVTTTFWDRVFGTYREPSMIRVPRSLAMDWLIDPATGDINAAFQGHYQLRGQAG